MIRAILRLLKRDPRDLNGNTPLMLAARSGDTDTVWNLIAAGASVNAKNRSGETALHNAAQFGRYVTASVLISSGADMDARTHAGLTPLHYAARSGRDGAVSVLISSGADINAVDLYGYTPLITAIISRRWSVIPALDIKREVRVYEEKLEWPVHECAGYLVIGCQAHRIGEWRLFADRKISSMHEDALSFWDKHGPAILAWADR